MKKPEGRLIAGCYNPDQSPLWAREQKANAAFIVRACNAHEALLEACKAMLAYVPRDGTAERDVREMAESAIALAEKGAVS